MTEKKAKQYVLGEDKKEATRLDFQHGLLLKLRDGNLLHPSIDKSKILKVADVGTGTGIWLKDVSKLLDGYDASSRQYGGFDITPSLFSQETSESFRFFVQDTLQPFPENFHNTYDFVHVRFMAVAFKAENWQVAVGNVLQLLKPGGYLQWDEFEHGLWGHDPSFKNLAETVALGRAFLDKLGFSRLPSQDLLKAFTHYGVQNIKIENYSSSRHPELASEYQIWDKDVSRSGWIAPALLMGGKSKEEADERVEKILIEWDEALAQGCMPLLPWNMLLGQKV